MTTTFDKINQALDADMNEKKAEEAVQTESYALNTDELSALRICADHGHSTTPEVLLRLMDMVKPFAPAGYVDPERAQQGGEPAQHVVSVPPAGDVEVYQAGVHVPGKYLPHVKEVVLLEDHHAHVTRLTAERDGTGGLVEQLRAMTWARDLCHASRMKAQDELNKARDLLKKHAFYRSDSGNGRCAECEGSTVEGHDPNCELGNFIAHQPAPAATCGRCEASTVEHCDGLLETLENICSLHKFNVAAVSASEVHRIAFQAIKKAKGKRRRQMSWSMREFDRGYEAFLSGSLRHLSESAQWQHGWDWAAERESAPAAKVEPQIPAGLLALLQWMIGPGQCEEPLQFLRLWMHGDFDTCRKEWPEVPEECYTGAEVKDAPAAKREEHLCLLCLDEKTVPGPNAGDFVRDGEEG